MQIHRLSEKQRLRKDFTTARRAPAYAEGVPLQGGDDVQAAVPAAEELGPPPPRQEQWTKWPRSHGNQHSDFT